MKKTIAFMMLVSMLTVAACATTGGNFSKIYPGMTQSEVTKAMKKGPTFVKSFNDDYSAWYYNEDRCLLFEKDAVVGKDTSKNRNIVDVLGMTEITEKRGAICVPPNSSEKAKVERKFDTPFGSVSK
ncbi:MAG: hypothetical protein ABIE74_11065 [Pseudomonadota bacterium]